jgi:peptidoglycan/LPS O-acetylase OafA/YrhL
MTQKIPQLDAVRGIAILLVLIHNTDVFPSLPLEAISTYGWMGVNLFFVLSGFLITGILPSSPNPTSRIFTLAVASGFGRFTTAYSFACC